MQITIEQKALENNLHQLLKTMPKKKPAEPGTAEKPEDKGKQVEVGLLEISDIKVNAKLLQAGTVKLNISSITLQNLGSDEKLTIPALIRKIFTAISRAISEKGVNVLPEDIIKNIKSVIPQPQQVIQKSKDILEKGKDIGTGITETLKGVLEKK